MDRGISGARRAKLLKNRLVQAPKAGESSLIRLAL
jgi:hypothetical protein